MGMSTILGVVLLSYGTAYLTHMMLDWLEGRTQYEIYYRLNGKNKAKEVRKEYLIDEINDIVYQGGMITYIDKQQHQFPF